MYKFFAKTLFTGKNVVFLPHCHSTNELAKSMAKSNGLSNGSIVITDFQENGRGQQGNVWVSEKGKNLLFTIILKPADFTANRQYLLNVMSAVAIHKTLVKLLPSAEIAIKWPNDIYVNDLKIAGILIETTISAGRLETVFCGIGLNVNQGHFSLNTATSMLLEGHKTFDRDSVLEELLLEIEDGLAKLADQPNMLLEYYHEHLFGKDQMRHFLIDGAETEGIIQGIDEQGKLIVEIGTELRHFAMKEISFLH